MAEFTVLFMKEERVFVKFDSEEPDFFLRGVEMGAAAVELVLFDVEPLLFHFFEEFFNLEVLFFDFLMQIGVVLLNEGLLPFEFLQVFNVSVDFVVLELNLLFAL